MAKQNTRQNKNNTDKNDIEELVQFLEKKKTEREGLRKILKRFNTFGDKKNK